MLRPAIRYHSAALRFWRQSSDGAARGARTDCVQHRRAAARPARPGRPRAGARSRHHLHLQSHRGLLQHAGAVTRPCAGWRAYHKLKESLLEPYLYTLPRERAVKHAFRVASGLDSMVLGEPQILGQMKEAVRSAEAAGTLGLVLHKLFQQILLGGQGSAQPDRDRRKRRCRWPRRRSSSPSASIPASREQKMLFIGAGEMIELCATHFAAQRPRAMTFANRTLERAQELARALRRQRPVAQRSARLSRAATTSS